MEISTKEDLVNQILSLADKLFRQLLPAVPKELLSLDITMPQLKILLLLYIHGPLRMGAIASELDVTLPTATSLVDHLVEKEYVSRENQMDDRRVVICRLSEDGKKAVAQFWESARLRSQQILQNMEADKLQLFVGALEDMLRTSKTIQEQYLKKDQV